MRTRPLTLGDLHLGENPLLMILERVEKPGNLGAVLRSADAAAADAVIICDPLTDIYNPNIIRSSIGAVFTVPCVACTTRECISFLKEKDIRNHPDRSRLLKAVGQSAGKDFYEVDKPIKTRSGDAILLCSDGFWEYVDENEMSRCLKSASSSDEWLKMMEDIALNRGKESSMDNYSAIAVRF